MRNTPGPGPVDVTSAKTRDDHAGPVRAATLPNINCFTHRRRVLDSKDSFVGFIILQVGKSIASSSAE
jgi:hypothetical protein